MVIKAKVESVIAKGGDVKSEKKKSISFKKILLRIPSEMLDRMEVDIEEEFCGNPGKRNLWILKAIQEKLDR